MVGDNFGFKYDEKDNNNNLEKLCMNIDNRIEYFF